MTISQILFSFSGRISRETYWWASVGIAAGAVAWAILVALIGAGFRNGDPTADTFPLILLAPIYLWILWCSLAVSVKRWHDRGKSGLWTFIQLIPYIGPLWALIELGFLKGTEGPNEFGDGSY
jgi:uncharacterized membrane protein YhaH (DUF805 family)